MKHMRWLAFAATACMLLACDSDDTEPGLANKACVTGKTAVATNLTITGTVSFQPNQQAYALVFTPATSIDYWLTVFPCDQNVLLPYDGKTITITADLYEHPADDPSICCPEVRYGVISKLTEPEAAGTN